MQEQLERATYDKRVAELVAMPHWEFLIVMGDGIFAGPCAGTTRNDIYYSEHQIYGAYFQRYPDAEPLF